MKSQLTGLAVLVGVGAILFGACGTARADHDDYGRDNYRYNDYNARQRSGSRDVAWRHERDHSQLERKHDNDHDKLELEHERYHQRNDGGYGNSDCNNGGYNSGYGGYEYAGYGNSYRNDRDHERFHEHLDGEHSRAEARLERKHDAEHRDLDRRSYDRGRRYDRGGW